MRSCLLALIGLLAIGAARADECDGPRLQRLLCRDLSLADLSGGMDRELATARAQLSPEGRTLLAQGQAGWRNLADACLQPDASDDAADACLLGAYEHRADELRRAVIGQGPFTFERVDVYARSNAGSVRHLAYPRIDRPAMPRTLAWNKTIRSETALDARCAEGRAETDRDFHILWADPRLITLRWTDTIYCHGLAGSPDAQGARNDVLLLGEPPRPLQAADLFRDAGYRWTLAAFALRDLRSATRRPVAIDGKRLADIASDPANWLPMRDGLVVVIPAGSVVRGVASREILIGWPHLRGLLAAGAPVPEAAL